MKIFVGYVPSNYVKKEKPSIFDSIKKKVKKGTNSHNTNSKTLPSNNSPSKVAIVESPAITRRMLPEPVEAIGSAIVKYNYQAKQQDELSLVKGSRILILGNFLNLQKNFRISSEETNII